MKKLFITLSLAILTLGLSAQASANASQIKWTVVAKKTGPNTVDIAFRATLAPTWHIWSQMPGDDMLIPPTFTFKDKTIVAVGKAKEIGKKISKAEEGFKNKLNYYEGTVVFVQRVKIGKQKTIAGSINYQICDPTKCLPPSDFDFNATIK
jgi:DsbC/DsbD-like thiol-disulfide interchange protein